MANSTPDTPEVSETKLAALKMDELRSHARKLGIDGADELHKPELLAKVKDHHYAQAHGGKHRPDTGSGSTGGAGGPSTVNEDHGRRSHTGHPGSPQDRAEHGEHGHAAGPSLLTSPPLTSPPLTRGR